MGYQNILLSCTLAIGDVVIATSAAALLKKIYPTAKITFMVKQLAEEIVTNNPVIDQVIAPKYQQKKMALGNMQALVQDLKLAKYDLFISLDGKVRTALLAWLANIPVRVGPTEVFGSNTKMPWILTHNIVVGNFRSTHYSDVLQGMIREFTGSDLSAMPVLPATSASDEQVAERLLAKLGKRRLTIGICAKTNPLKTWPKERFAKLIDQLSAKYDAAFYVIGGSYDRDYIEELLGQTKGRAVNFCGETSLAEVITVMHKTDVFISLDTSPMHLASVVDLPMVAIFGSTSAISMAPQTKKAIILAAKLPCVPCIPSRVQVYPGISKRIGPKTCEHQQCMKEISVELVENAVDQLIKKYCN